MPAPFNRVLGRRGCPHWSIRARARTGAHGRDEGFGLFEVVLAILILLIALIPISNLLTNVLTQTGNSRERLSALSYAESVIETLNNNGPPISNSQPNVPSTQAEGSKTIQGVPYTASAKFAWANPGGGTPNLCTSGLVPVLNLTVTVTWGASQSVTDTTDLYYPPSGIQTYGYLGVQVSGSPITPATTPPNDSAGNTWATRLNAMTVTVTPNPQTSPATTYTATPGSNGCAFLALPPANYTATISQSTTTGFTNSFIANYNEATTQTQGATGQTPISVNAGVMTPVTFQYDEGALVAIQYPNTTLTEDGIVCPNVGSLMCITTGETATSTTSPNTGASATMSVETTGGTWTAVSLPSTTSPSTSPASHFATETCTGSATNLCIAIGWAPSGASYQAVADVAQTGTATKAQTWTANGPGATVGSLSQIVCPSATTCYALGENPAGTAAMILTATVSSTAITTWTTDTFTGTSPTYLSNIACTSATVCYATGLNGTTPLAYNLTTTANKWQSSSLSGASVSSISGLACAGTVVCAIIGTNSGGTGVLLSTAAGTGAPTWTSNAMPTGTTVASLTQIVCPSATVCMVIGSSTASGVTSGLILGGAVASPAVTLTKQTMPTGVTVSSVNQIACPSATTCLATGATSTSAVILTGKTGQTWLNNPGPSANNVSELTQLACPSTTLCLVSGYTGGSPGSAIVLSGVLSTSTAQTFAVGSIPSTVSPVFYSDLGCTSTTVCTLSGATQSGAFILNGASGSPWSWTNATPSSGFTGGMYANGLAVSVGNSNLLPSSPLVASAYSSSGADPPSIGPLFPFSSGYSVGAGDCTSDITNSSAASTIPGGTTSSPNATVVLPLSLLSVQVLHNGVPVSGETVKATVANGSCTNADVYTLQKTGPDGLSRTAVIDETYTVAVSGTYSGSVSVQVGTAGSTVSSVLTPAPIPIQVNV